MAEGRSCGTGHDEEMSTSDPQKASDVHTSETGQADSRDGDATFQEQQMIALLAKEGLALVDAALSYGHEGERITDTPRFSWL